MNNWLKSQRKMPIDGVKAVLFDQSPKQILQRSPHTWTPEEVSLIRTLLRPPQKQILVAMELRGLAEELGAPDLDQYEAAKLRAWLDPLRRHIAPRCTWSVHFCIDGCPGSSQVWGWKALRFSRTYDLLCEFGTFDDCPAIAEFGDVPIGLIERRDSVRAAAVVISNHPQAGCANVFESGEITCASSLSTRLRGLDVYRLMLAWDAHPDAATMTEAELEEHWQGCCTVDHVRRLMGERVKLRIREYPRDHPFYTDPNYVEVGPIHWEPTPPKNEQPKRRNCKRS